MIYQLKNIFTLAGVLPDSREEELRLVVLAAGLRGVPTSSASSVLVSRIDVSEKSRINVKMFRHSIIQFSIEIFFGRLEQTLGLSLCSKFSYLIKISKYPNFMYID